MERWSAFTVFGVAFLGAFLVGAGLVVAIFVPARSWRDEQWSFTASTGEIAEPSGEAPEECPPIATNAVLTCAWLGDGQWLWSEENGPIETLRHYPSRRLVPPHPGTLCNYTLADDGRLAAVCRGEGGVPAAFVEDAGSFRRLAERGDLAPFLVEELNLRPVATTRGLVAAKDDAFYVWRPGRGVDAYPSLSSDHRIYHLSPSEADSVFFGARVFAPNAGQIALKVLAALAALGGAWLLRRANGHGREGAMIGGVIAGVIALVAVAVIGAFVLAGMAGGIGCHPCHRNELATM